MVCRVHGVAKSHTTERLHFTSILRFGEVSTLSLGRRQSPPLRNEAETQTFTSPTEDETAGWHHQHDGHEFEQAPGVGDGQGSLVSRIPWGGRV